MKLGEKKINSETVDNVKSRERNMDDDSTRYFLFEKTKPNACRCNLIMLVCKLFNDISKSYKIF